MSLPPRVRNVRDFGEAPRRFGIDVSRPGELLRRL